MLELLRSKTLSAPSFGRNGKQLIESPYSFTPDLKVETHDESFNKKYELKLKPVLVKANSAQMPLFVLTETGLSFPLFHFKEDLFSISKSILTTMCTILLKEVNPH